jgi:Xaa-Pro aminopeptidase
MMRQAAGFFEKRPMFPSVTNTPASEIGRRIEALQFYLQKNGTDGAMILQKADLFYFSGTAQDACLYIPAQGPPILMVRKSLERAAAESSIQNFVPLNSLKQVRSILKDRGVDMPMTLGMELDVIPARLYFTCQGIFKEAKILDVSHEIRMVRSVKSDYEIQMMEAAGKQADRLFEHVGRLIEPGISEIELAGRVEAVARKLGHQGFVRMRMWGGELFYGHLMSGPDAALPSFLASPTGGMGTGPAFPQGAGFKTIRAGEPVLVDYAFAFNGYIADQTRIFAIGELPKSLVTGHTVMLEVQQRMREFAKPGVISGDLYEMALDFVQQHGYADYFMGADENRIRFVGHGVGTELDEYPFIAKDQEQVLKEGMTIALEPKLIFPGQGVVGIENTHVVTSTGLRPLTHFQEEIVFV